MEAFAVVDNKNNFLPNDTTNVELLQSYLDAIAASC
jgi:hypothetical protein